MPIPDYQSIMLPLLKFAGDQREYSLREAIEVLAQEFNLTEDERKKLLPSGLQEIFDNRVGWARTYLKKASLLDSTKRGFFNITPRGLDVLRKNPKTINVAFLRSFPEFVEFQSVKKDQDESESEAGKAMEKTPEESLESGYQRIRSNLSTELLAKAKSSSPKFFEKLVVELLLKMGYGSFREDAGKATGGSGDEGIDGLINEDKLGLDVIYLQAKRWDSIVGRPEVQKFAGALQGRKAKKGVFITTSKFSDDAHDFVSKIDNKIVLIDGEKLAQLMIDYDIGVSKHVSFEIKKIDWDYFTEE